MESPRSSIFYSLTTKVHTLQMAARYARCSYQKYFQFSCVSYEARRVGIFPRHTRNPKTKKYCFQLRFKRKIEMSWPSLIFIQMIVFVETFGSPSHVLHQAFLSVHQLILNGCETGIASNNSNRQQTHHVHSWRT